jgi:acetyl esterase/lipase
MRCLCKVIAVVALLFAMVPMATAQKKEQKKDQKEFKLPSSVELLRDVEFGSGGGRPLKMHILRPKTLPREAMPVLVWIHGGGWQNGSKESGLARLAPFAERGYLCASAEYRLSGEAIFPAQIEDCKCAIRFLRVKSKQFQLDPDRIGVWGSSAGGHLVSLLGTSEYVRELEGKGGWQEFSSRVNAVCDFCGPSDFVKIVGKSDGAKGAVGKLLGGAPAEKLDLAKLASPVAHISKNAPPFLIVHGDKDNLVPLEQAQILHEALKKAGVPVTLHIAQGQGHGLGGPEVNRVVQEFFDKQFKVTSSK